MSRREEIGSLCSPCGIARSPREFYSLRDITPAVSPATSPNGQGGTGRKRKGRRKASLGLKRKSRVKKGVCGEIKVPSTRTKLTIKTNAPSAIKSKVLLLPTATESISPTKVVIKANPLFTSDHTYYAHSFRHQVGDENISGSINSLDQAGVFGGQQSKIRKTKEKEMISAIMDITKCGSREQTSVFKKIKRCIRSRKGNSDITTTTVSPSQRKKGARKLRYRVSPKHKMTDMEQMLTQI